MVPYQRGKGSIRAKHEERDKHEHAAQPGNSRQGPRSNDVQPPHGARRAGAGPAFGSRRCDGLSIRQTEAQALVLLGWRADPVQGVSKGALKAVHLLGLISGEVPGLMRVAHEVGKPAFF